jgi:hypothetical protein
VRSGSSPDARARRSCSDRPPCPDARDRPGGPRHAVRTPPPPWGRGAGFGAKLRLQPLSPRPLPEPVRPRDAGGSGEPTGAGPRTPGRELATASGRGPLRDLRLPRRVARGGDRWAVGRDGCPRSSGTLGDRSGGGGGGPPAAGGTPVPRPADRSGAGRSPIRRIVPDPAPSGIHWQAAVRDRWRASPIRAGAAAPLTPRLIPPRLRLAAAHGIRVAAGPGQPGPAVVEPVLVPVEAPAVVRPGSVHPTPLRGGADPAVVGTADEETVVGVAGPSAGRPVVASDIDFPFKTSHEARSRACVARAPAGGPFHRWRGAPHGCRRARSIVAFCRPGPAPDSGRPVAAPSVASCVHRHSQSPYQLDRTHTLGAGWPTPPHTDRRGARIVRRRRPRPRTRVRVSGSGRTWKASTDGRRSSCSSRPLRSRTMGPPLTPARRPPGTRARLLVTPAKDIAQLRTR